MPPEAGREWGRTLGLRSFAPPSALPGISPTRGEIGRHRHFRQSPALHCRMSAKARSCRSPPSGGDGRQGRGGRCPANPIAMRRCGSLVDVRHKRRSQSTWCPAPIPTGRRSAKRWWAVGACLSAMAALTQIGHSNPYCSLNADFVKTISVLTCALVKAPVNVIGRIGSGCESGRQWPSDGSFTTLPGSNFYPFTRQRLAV
jgi:hypothetical protein